MQRSKPICQANIAVAIFGKDRLLAVRTASLTVGRVEAHPYRSIGRTAEPDAEEHIPTAKKFHVELPSAPDLSLTAALACRC